ncbi:hypothetical protein D3OALGB2SA_1098 [Olavius algarvensis associated proteobacterium Delta 3]|nr:hypothetical protein D3OALGB2SA_1098 [Olavius algarvensis associated proteobacterium Delta 3]
MPHIAIEEEYPQWKQIPVTLESPFPQIPTEKLVALLFLIII